MLLTVIGSYYVFATAPSSTFTISPGIYPGAPSYTIWREGDYYFAKNSNGKIEFCGTNASQVIINAIQPNSKIFLKAGVYTIDSTITKAVDNVIIEGEGNGTIIKVADNTPINAFNITDVSGWVIRNLQIDGNRANQVNQDDFNIQNGIMIGNAAGTSIVTDVTIENVFIHSLWANGIMARSSNIQRLRIQHCTIKDTYGDGITVRLGQDVIISENTLINCGHVYQNFGGSGTKRHAIYIYGSNFIIANNIILNSGGDGIEAYPLSNGTITDNVIVQAGRIGIYVQQVSGQGKRVTVSGNTIAGAGVNRTDAEWLYGIHIVGGSVAVVGNSVWDVPAVGIYIASGADNSTIEGNVIQNVEGKGIVVYQCNYVTISGNTIRHVYNGSGSGIGIGIQQSNYTTISGNTIVDCGRYGIDLYNALYTNIIGNTIIAASYNMDYGIRESHPSDDYNTIIGCNVWGTYTYVPIQIQGVNTEVHLCYNGTSWIP